jgi:hypothetical protein
MGSSRNGARTFLTVIAHACRLSHLPGFRSGLDTILGPDAAADLYGFWTPLCSFVDSLIALDDWYNKRDATLPDTDGSEDGPFG